jgi:hypothetical protein
MIQRSAKHKIFFHVSSKLQRECLGLVVVTQEDLVLGKQRTNAFFSSTLFFDTSLLFVNVLCFVFVALCVHLTVMLFFQLGQHSELAV